MIEERKYHGDGRCHYEPLPEVEPKEEPYIASPELVEAVNVSLILRRPLLLEGDPGCGKTRLAYAVAYELGYPLKTCYIRSTSRAADLLYTYDALRRLYDIQERKSCGVNREPPSRSEYIQWHELGEAILLSATKKMPSVVLIDEIDKADIDFPNDLLLVLDEWKFKVNETGQSYEASKESNASVPLGIITSNREKELPGAFLRRCLYFYIDFPEAKTLEKIVSSHFSEGITPVFEEGVRKFMELRKKQIRWRKLPGTSELIDWLRLLETDEQQKKISASSLASLSLGSLPYIGVLIKTQSDLDAIRRA